jgi:DNA-binding GntR family transcriptional regulator
MTSSALPVGERNGGESLSLIAYRQLRAAIIRGEFRPKERLVETELAERLDISRTPVREALARLAADGLVTSVRRGWAVHEFSTLEIAEIFETRIALEGFAAGLAAERASDEQLTSIKALHEAQGLGLVQAPRAELVDLNEDLHNAIYAGCGNARLVDVIHRNSDFHFNYRVAILYTDDEAEASIRGHDQIVQAICGRRRAEAEEATRDHIADGLKVILSKVR